MPKLGRAWLVDWLLQHDWKHCLLQWALVLGFGLRVEGIEPEMSGTHRRVYSATWNDQAMVIMILVAPELGAFHAERAAYALLQDSDLPVAQLLFSALRPRGLYLPTTIVSKLPGVLLDAVALPHEQRLHLYRQAGALLARLHTIRVRNFGPLSLQNGEYVGMYASWRDYWTELRMVETAGAYLHERGWLSRTELALLHEVGMRVRDTQFGQATLLHGDYRPANLLTDGQRITGIIDLADALAGDPRYDVGISLAFLSPSEQAAFREGYGPLADDPLVPCYTLLAAAHRLAFCSQIREQHGDRSGALTRIASEMHRTLRETLANMTAAGATSA